MADVNSTRCRRERLTVVHPRAAGIDIGSPSMLLRNPQSLMMNQFGYTFRGRDALPRDCMPDSSSLSDEEPVLCFA